MMDIEQQIQFAIENLTGNESLTGNLNDTSANLLLEWGIIQVKYIFLHGAQQSEESIEDYTYGKLRILRKVFRTINNWAPFRMEKDLPTNIAVIQELFTSLNDINGGMISLPTENELADFLSTNHNLEQAAFVNALLQFINNNIDG